MLADDVHEARAQDLRGLGDRELFRVSALWGRQRKEADRRFLATLVEIERRRILGQRRAYANIQEYARRVGGVAADVVTEVLRLGRAFAAYPRSWALFSGGRVGWTQLRAVATVLDRKPDAAWAAILATTPRAALEQMVRAWHAPPQAVRDRAPLPPTTSSPSPATPPTPPPALTHHQHPAPATTPPTLEPPSPFAPARAAAAPWVPAPSREGVVRDAVAAGSPPPPTPRAGEPTPPTGPQAAPPREGPGVELLETLSPATLARLESRRRALEARLGAPLGLDVLVAGLLDATAPLRADAPAMPARLLPGAGAGAGMAGPGSACVTVIFKQEETGRLFMNQGRSVRELSPVEGLLRAREGTVPVFELSALESDARASARQAQGFDPPPRVERLVWLRAGGGCETPGCGRRGAQVHHRVRRAERVDHDPDRLALLCAACHAAAHTGLLDDEGAWRLPDAPRRLGWVDRAVVGWRSNGLPGKARHPSRRVPLSHPDAPGKSPRPGTTPANPPVCVSSRSSSSWLAPLPPGRTGSSGSCPLTSTPCAGPSTSTWPGAPRSPSRRSRR